MNDSMFPVYIFYCSLITVMLVILIVQRLMKPKNKPGIYLAGPMAGCDDRQMNDWRDYLVRTLNHKYHIENPVARDHRFDYHDELAAEIVEGDKAAIDKCAYVIANPWKHSTGTPMEIIYAWERGKTVILISPNRRVGPWHKYHSHFIFNSPEEVAAFLG